MLSSNLFAQPHQKNFIEEAKDAISKGQFDLAESKLDANFKTDKKASYVSDYCAILFNHFRKTGEYDLARKEINRVLNKYKIVGEKLGEATVYGLWLDLYTDKFKDLITQTDSLLTIPSFKKQHGWYYYFRGQGNNETGDYTAASNDYMSALKLFKENKNFEGLSYAYSGLGDIQRNIHEIKKSKEYYEKALASARNAKSITAEINALSLMGISYSINKEYDEGLKYFKQAFELAESDSDSYNMARGLNNIGNGNLRKGNYEEAIKANNASLKICIDNKMDYGVLVNYLNFSRIYQSSKDYPKALSSLDKASAFIVGKNFPAEEAELKKGYAQIYEALGSYEKSLKFYKEYTDLRQKLVSEETQKAVKELEIKYETEIKDRQIEKMDYELKINKSHNRNLLLGLGLIILIAGFSVFFLIYRNKSIRELYERNIENLHSHNLIRRINIPDEDPLRKVFDKILKLLENEEMYKKSTLSLSEVAELAGSNEKYVSNAIAKFTESNYSNFINLYRINEAKRLMLEEPGINMNDVMISCGFNSRTPFYNAFMKFTGMSPSQFKEMKSKA